MNVNQISFSHRVVSLLLVLFLFVSLLPMTNTARAESDFTTAVSVLPGTIVAGQALTLTAQVTSSTAQSLLVDLEIFNAATGQKVFQEYKDDLAAAAGVTLDVPFRWVTPSGLPKGKYIVSLGLFGAGWNGMHKWHAGAAEFTVTDGTGLPPFTSSATVAPDTIIQGGNAEVTATVVSSTTLTGQAEIIIREATGMPVYTETFPNLALTAGQVKTLRANWKVPADAPPHPHYVEVAVYNADKTERLHLNMPAATFTVSEGSSVPLSYSSRAVLASQTVKASETLKFLAEVTATQNDTALIDVEIYDAAGRKAHQVVFNNQTLVAGQPLQIPVSWDIPLDAPGGVYSIRIGVFPPGWGEIKHWNSTAGSVRVTALTFSSSAVVDEPTVTAGQPVGISAVLSSSDTLGARVSLRILDPLGTVVHEARYDHRGVNAGDNDYGTSWTVPALAYNGDYAVQLLVTHMDGSKTYHRNDELASFRVENGVTLAITSGATANPADVKPGQPVALDAWVMSSASLTANVTLAVYDANGTKVASRDFANVAFVPGTAATKFQHAFTPTRENIDGTYTVAVELYNADKSRRIHNHANAATFTMTTPADAPAPQPAQPRSLPTHFSIGVQAYPSQNGLYGWMQNTGVPWDYGYQYLNGGVNTATGWKSWETGSFPGSFAYNYAKAADARGYTPYFTYYQMLQSNGSCTGCGEVEQDLSNLNNTQTMKTYYEDFKLLMKLIGTGTYDGRQGFGKRVIVHIEPDLHGYAQQAVLDNARCHGFCTGQGNDPSLLKASVANTGMRELADLPNTYQGYNWALLRLRDLYAPNAILAYHVSSWGTKHDVGSNTDPTLDIQGLGRMSGEFAAKSGTIQVPAGITPYDLITNDVSDRDAAFYKKGGSKTSWWDRLNLKLPNFHQWEAYFKAVLETGGRKGMVWQVPVGNQYFRTMDNTPGHYQDNRVEYFFSHIDELIDTGVIGFLVGYGQGDQTAQFDDEKDGITNPAPICTSDGMGSGTICNDHESTVADDDGGYLRMAAGQYYQNKRMLP